MKNELLYDLLTDVVSAISDLQNQIDDVKSDVTPLAPLDNLRSEKLLNGIRDKVELLIAPQSNNDVQPQLNKPDVSGQSEPLPQITDADYKQVQKILYPADNSKKFRR